MTRGFVLIFALASLIQSVAGAQQEKLRQYVMRKIVTVMPGRYSDLPPIEVKNLTLAEVHRFRSLGYRVELNKRMQLMTVRQAWRIGSALPTKPLWALDAIHARDANKYPNGDGTGITICLVDTGVSKNHPALVGQIAGGENFTGLGAVNDTTDVQGHGTLLAGVIAGRDVGNFRGVAPGAKILVAKVWDKAGGGDYASIARGIQYCIGRSQVINLSFGSDSESEIIGDVIDQAIGGHGMSVIAAAGNTAAVAFPARHPDVLAVGAIDPNFNVATFSARGVKLDCVAPGDQIFGPNLLGYGVYSGTSLSAAFASGIEAIRWSRKSSVLGLVDLGKPSTDQGHGLVDAELTAR